MFSRRALLLAFVAVALLAGCSKEEPAPAPTATLVFPTVTPTADPNPPQVRSAVWLFDVQSGSKTILFEATDLYARETEFAEGQDAVRITTQPRVGNDITPESRLIALDGRELSRGPVEARCRDLPRGAEVSGRVYADVSCGPISPDGQWMTYQAIIGERELASGYRIPIWDQWAVNLQSDERRLLQKGLEHCGGCDGRFGPEWSPSSRYVIYAEWMQSGSTFLSDIQAETTREIYAGNTESYSKPEWAASGDLLAYPGPNGMTVLEDLRAGTRLQLQELPWPARFDVSGAYLYAPAFPLIPVDPAPASLKLYELRSGTIASLPGSPPRDGGRFDFVTVVGAGGTFVAALENAPGCDGTTIYRGSTALTCVRDGVGASISPDGSRVVLLRKTGEVRRIWATPQPYSFDVYDIILVEVSSGAQRVLAGDALGESGRPVASLWDNTGTLLLAPQPFLSFGP